LEFCFKDVSKLRDDIKDKEEIIQYLTSQQSVSKTQLKSYQESLKKLEQTVASTLSNFQDSLDSDSGETADELMPRLAKVFASKIELNREMDSLRDSMIGTTKSINKQLHNSFNLLRNV